jgi:hypothetical protein
MEENIKLLIETAIKMRQHQKDYSKTKAPIDLMKAQLNERRLDILLEPYRQVKVLHPTLF